MQQGGSETSKTMGNWADLRLQLMIEGLLVGLIAGFVVITYRIVLEAAENTRHLIYSYLGDTPALVGLWFAVLMIIAFILGYIAKREPLIGGSGIPQVKGQLAGQLFISWPKVLVGKFIGGVLAIGAGLSLGREGPSVQLGGAVGHGLGRIWRRSRMENKYLITCGASAGLAAAFNAPLSGVVFALEELHKNFSPLVLSSAMAASLAADFLSQYYFGQKPVMSFHTLGTMPLKYYFYLVILGVLAGLLGILFNSSIIRTQNLYKRLPLPAEFRPALPLFIAGILGIILPDVLGGGHHLVVKLGNNSLLPSALILLLLVKFAFTMLSYGSGVPGGIFLPLLVIGALLGKVIGLFSVTLFHLPQEFTDNFLIYTMAGYFTAIVKAPITGTILITEMTGSFNHLLPVSVVSLMAYLVTDWLGSRPIYDVLLEQILAKGQSSLNLEKGRKKIILEVPVCLGSVLDRCYIKEINWPKECLLVGVIRGEKEIIPKGNTRLQVGDCLVILTNESEEAGIRESLLELAGS